MIRKFLTDDAQMANKCMKKYSTSIDIREMQITNTLKFPITPVRIAVIKI